MFHVWRSFSFDENAETIDAYVTHIRQVAALLCYGEPQILEIFKNTLVTKLYWILFPIEDLRQAVEMAKRILTKEKIDRQLSRQSSSTPFMSIRDGHNRKVSFDTKEELGDKIDKLAVMMGKLATRDNRTNREFKPQIYQGRGRGQNRGNYDRCSYDQQRYQSRYRSDSGDRRQYRQYRGRPRYEKTIEVEISEETWGALTDRIADESIEIVIEKKDMIEAGKGLQKGHLPEAITTIEIGVQAIVGPGQDQEQVQIETE